MDPAKEQIEHIFQNVRYAVRVVPGPPETPGGPPGQRKVLTFATQDECELWSFPLGEQAAIDVARMLSPVVTAPASALNGLHRPAGR